jgi:hypothetical protein
MARHVPIHREATVTVELHSFEAGRGTRLRCWQSPKARNIPREFEDAFVVDLVQHDADNLIP